MRERREGEEREGGREGKCTCKWERETHDSSHAHKNTCVCVCVPSSGKGRREGGRVKYEEAGQRGGRRTRRRERQSIA